MGQIFSIINSNCGGEMQNQEVIPMNVTPTKGGILPIQRQKISKKKISHLKMYRPYLIVKAEFRRTIPCLTLNETYVKGEGFVEVNSNFLLYLEDSYSNRARVEYFKSALQEKVIFVKRVEYEINDSHLVYSL